MSKKQAKTSDGAVLRYVGNGDYFPGVPTRDLTQSDIDAGLPVSVDELLASKIYETVNAGGSDGTNE